MIPQQLIGVPVWHIGLAMLATVGIGWFFGSIARWLLRGRARLGLATSVVIGMVGTALGLMLASVISPDASLRSVLSISCALGASVLAIALYGAIAAHFQRPVRTTVPELLARGESERVEFKSTARVNLHTGAKDDRMEQVIAKTVCGFLNSDGGTLLIGVDDEGTPLGLAADLGTMKSPDIDRYELWLRDLLTTCLGQTAAASVSVEFVGVPAGGTEQQVCRVTCHPAPVPVYLRPGKGAAAEMWLRAGNSTRKLGVDEATEYVMHRWPLSLGASSAAQLRALVRFSEVR